MSIHDASYIIRSFAHYVSYIGHNNKMINLITKLSMDHSEDFFNQNIEQIRNSENKQLIFFAMCMFNQNLSLIKQMVEQMKCDPNLITKKGHSCLSLALIHNKNLEVIKYLIEDCKSDVTLLIVRLKHRV